MKTAVSLPDPLFRQAEAAARKMKVSRSQLSASALAEYLRRRNADAITRQMNAVCAQLDSSLDPGMEQAHLEVLARERGSARWPKFSGENCGGQIFRTHSALSRDFAGRWWWFRPRNSTAAWSAPSSSRPSRVTEPFGDHGFAAIQY